MSAPPQEARGVRRVTEVVVVDPAESRTRRVLSQLRHNRAAVAALVWIALTVVLAVVGPWIAPHDHTETDVPNALASPSGDHWLGTDGLGRDVFSRLIVAARPSMVVAFQAVVAMVIVAVPVAVVAGYVGGRLDSLVSRAVDAMFTFPPLLLGIAVVSMLGAGVRNLSLTIAVLFIPGLIRLIRGQVLNLREETFVEASRSLGASSGRVMWWHIVPNVAPVAIIAVSQNFGYVLLTEAALSYLGLGQPPPHPSWGGMVRDGYDAIFNQGLLVVWPGIAIGLTVLAFNVLGDALRDAMGRASASSRRIDTNVLAQGATQ